MSKKSVNLFCFSCDVDFTVRMSEENTKMKAEYCPFCGEEIDEDDGDAEESDDSNENEDDKSRW